MIDSFRTVSVPSTARLTRKKSRFIAWVLPVSTPAGMREEVARIGRRHHDASHCCYAARLLERDTPLAYSDDAGEPAGSAGLPILQQLEGSNLLNVLAVVVRYFGGTKLGIGGLVRTYSDVVQDAIRAAAIVVRHVEVSVSIAFSPELTSNVMKAIHRHGVRVDQIEYDTEAVAWVMLPPSLVKEFVAAIAEATGARAKVEISR